MRTYYTGKPRPILTQPTDQNIRYIALTRGQIAIVDADMYESLNSLRWSASPTRFGTFYAVRTTPEKKNLGMHQLVLGEREGYDVDHINRNGLDNRRENLRYATRSQNCMNRGIYKTSKSGVTGITFDPKADMWRVRIMINRKSKSLGYFKELKDAIDRRKQAELENFGEFIPNS